MPFVTWVQYCNAIVLYVTLILLILTAHLLSLVCLT
uniref:Uncharacterized protein n=1 Tax=Arundo donax TaxID=35708 RepID=A0A0A8YMF5_ARUDO